MFYVTICDYFMFFKHKSYNNVIMMYCLLVMDFKNIIHTFVIFLTQLYLRDVPHTVISV